MEKSARYAEYVVKEDENHLHVDINEIVFQDGTVGPGVSVIDNILYVIGGFDFIGPDSICHG